MTENFLFTSDSINDYLDHLTDEGRLIVVGHDPIEIMRLLSLSTSALNRKGVAEKTAMEQVYIVGSHHFPVFVLKKTPLETAEMVSIHQSIHELGYEPGLSYLPTIKLGGGTAHVAEAKFNECAMFFPPAIALSLGEIGLGDIRSALQEERLDISPVTDDSPFFYKFEAGIPQSVSLVFWASVVVLFLVIMAPIIYLKKRQISESKPKDKAGLDERLIRFVSLFSMLGVGFMLVEISTIQKFILFLGQPVLSVAVLLFSLMVGAGLGSIYSARFNTERLPRVLAFTALLVVSLLVAYAFSLSVILERLLGLPLAVRLLATVVMLLPPGFFMGFFFPSGIKLLKHAGMEEFVPWMWGLNGVASVAGSAATIVIAINFGFTEALLAGAAAYFIVFLVFFIPGNRSKEAVQM